MVKNYDYLLVNSTNDFLLEYTPLEQNDCYKLTNFSGGVGDALACENSNSKIKLFVDGRFHKQADLEVDLDKVEVVKLPVGVSQDIKICDSVEKNCVLGVDTRKVSQSRFESLKNRLEKKGASILSIPSEKKYSPTKKTAVFIDEKYSGMSFEKKCEKIKKPALITNSEEISYLCNLRDFNQDYAVKIDGKLLLLNDKSILFADYDIPSKKGFELRPLSEYEAVISKIDETVFVSKSSISAYDYSLLKNKKPIVSEVSILKSVKKSSELEHLKYCFEMTDKALFDTRNSICSLENLSEYDIGNILEQNFKKYGAKLLSFKSIVARNKNAALPHYNTISKDEILKDGDLVLIDCGAYYQGGLATDITRTFVKGTPSKLHIQVYTTVLKMFLNAFNYKIDPDKTTGFDIDKLARKISDENKIEGFEFSHGLGHGLGVCVHEAPPNLSKNEIAKTPILDNMCFTIEPGLYNENEFGIRLENSCYLQNGLIKSFSNMCYEKKLIDYSMLTRQEKEYLSEFEVL